MSNILLFLLFVVSSFSTNGIVFEPNYCSMTYMFALPGYKRMYIGANRFEKKYALYEYCEGWNCAFEAAAAKQQDSSSCVLFVTGNSDSYKQVRSLASVSLRYFESSSNAHNFLRFYTIDFDEQLSGLCGEYLYDQAEFLSESIRFLSRTYKHVILIGNSMGGLLASGLANIAESSDFGPRLPFVLTLSSPHLAPVVNTDLYMNEFYRRLRKDRVYSAYLNVSKTVYLSIYGGVNDVLVPGHACQFPRHQLPATNTFTVATTAIPGVWMTLDHICMVWCNELVVTLIQMLYEMDYILESNLDDKSQIENVVRRYMILGGDEDRSMIDSSSIRTYDANIREYELDYSPETGGTINDIIKLSTLDSNKDLLVFIRLNKNITNFSSLTLLTDCASKHRWLRTIRVSESENPANIDFRSHSPSNTKDETFRSRPSPQANEANLGNCGSDRIRYKRKRSKLNTASIPTIIEHGGKNLSLSLIVIILHKSRFHLQHQNKLFFELQTLNESEENNVVNTQRLSLFHPNYLNLLSLKSAAIRRKFNLIGFDHMWDSFRISVINVNCSTDLPADYYPYYLRFFVNGSNQDIYGRRHIKTTFNESTCEYDKTPSLLARTYGLTHNSPPILEIGVSTNCTMQLMIAANWPGILFNWIHMYGPILPCFVTSWLFVLISTKVVNSRILNSGPACQLLHLALIIILIWPFCALMNSAQHDELSSSLEILSLYQLWYQKLYDGFYIVIIFIIFGSITCVLIEQLILASASIAKRVIKSEVRSITGTKLLSQRPIAEILILSALAFILWTLTTGTFVYAMILIHAFLCLIFSNQANSIHIDCLIYLLLILTNSPIAIAFLKTKQIHGILGELNIFDNSLPMTILIFIFHLVRFTQFRDHPNNSYSTIKVIAFAGFSIFMSIATLLACTHNLYRLNLVLAVALASNALT